jgi:hypothetical protein
MRITEDAFYISNDLCRIVKSVEAAPFFLQDARDASHVVSDRASGWLDAPRCGKVTPNALPKPMK